MLTKQPPGNCQRNEDIEQLGNKKHVEGLDTVAAQEVLEIRFEADTRKGQREPKSLDILDTRFHGVNCGGIQHKRKQEGSANKPQNELRETLPDDTQSRFLDVFAIGGTAICPVNGNGQRCDTQ